MVKTLPQQIYSLRRSDDRCVNKKQLRSQWLLTQHQSGQTNTFITNKNAVIVYRIVYIDVV